ncbi:MAG: polysaccharide biosynthesis protein [Fimbriimonadales bacterium]|nr:polysaccharide biosynthesis protein [Fimbriimonadales bacterium]
MLLDGLMVAASLFLAFGLIADQPSHWIRSPVALPIALAVSSAIVGILGLRGLYRVDVRYVSLSEFLEIIGTCVAVSIGIGAADYYLHHDAPLNASLGPVLFAYYTISLLCGVRVIHRSLAWRARTGTSVGRQASRALIVRFGDAAERLIRELDRQPNAKFVVAGIVDDDPANRKLRIRGVPVVGTVEDLPELIEQLDIEDVIMASTDVPGAEVKRIFRLVRGTSARMRVVPTIDNLLRGSTLTPQMRDIEIQDLLRRPPVNVDLAKIAGYLTGEHVLITGGGGSIGGELARQVARLNPASLVLVGRGENSLYEIEQELIQTTSLRPHAIVADIRNRAAIEEVLARFRPTVIFHAAAHKHVPLMERNPIEAIENNALATRTLADLAAKYGVRKFIMLSTDKAVQPRSVMGASKRVCEMVVSAYGSTSETEFAAVRFGNVLGSRGSLVPLVQAQIRRGGPVKVTHPEMTRFFMTIPEAVQLVLQAGAMGKRGEIFLLDMGDPVRIDDLVRDIVRLHGLVPDEDIRIEYTGARPGEKLHESLANDLEDLLPTAHGKINMVRPSAQIVRTLLLRDLDRLEELCRQRRADEAKQMLMDIAWGRTPASVASLEVEPRLGTTLD